MSKRTNCECKISNVVERKAVSRYCDEHKKGFPTQGEAEKHMVDLVKDYIDEIEEQKLN